MLFTNTIAVAILAASSLAIPLNTIVAKTVQMLPRAEYWAMARKVRDSSFKKRAEYWAMAPKLRDSSFKKRAELDSQCEQAPEGIYCTYTAADIEAFGTGFKLDIGCVTDGTEISCFYPGATFAEE
ncbi:hypothetical protein ONS95_002179 [Cadophora gregata]|uniref:uncharacterized protein n=1 Tax=Cadophora gregata TaxID=51156 RepID=UPI0026DC12A3|nr:uncharacterized protein ONS95_002179 [Cadophora gregata]KAK0109487.1 hypothetical protein ONS95_002179 [Cadophora gregata]KAK0110885.1 hypothetical protein ONS96_002471 [Cadophora gregata f. sp. sojae]